MKKVHNLNELVDLVGKETVDKCFTEYLMLMVAGNHKLEELKCGIEDMNDTDMMSVADLKGRLE